ncbi:hypothetical protein [Acetobacter sp.]|uniref:hypothetical protein n=1 Tax=Acetobacter sp. TaxID=440 RepID=UPI0039EAB0CF
MQGRAMKAERANDDYNKAMVAALSGDGAFGGAGTDASDPQVNSYLGSDEAMNLAGPQDQSDPFAGAGTDAANPVTRDTETPSGISPVAHALLSPAQPTVGQAAQAGATDLITQHFLDHMRQAESGGNANATNPNSSATGAYQFTNPTWTELMRQHPDLGLTADGRTDPAQSQVAAKQLATDNLAYMLAHGVQSPTEGQAYLAHFAGAPTATNLVQADPNTPISQIMSPQQVAANPFLRNMTAGQVQDWAAQKMGGAGAPPVAPQNAQFSGGYSPQMADAMAPQPQAGPSMSALMGVLADPRANQQTRGVASALLQNQLQLQQVQQRYQMEQADPENVARRRYYDAETQRLMNQPQRQGAEYRILSPQEKQTLGLPAGGNYQMDATGKVSAIGGGGVNVLPSAPAGYYYQPGPDGQATLQPVPGGPVDQAKNTQADQARTTSDVIGRTGHDLLSAIDQSPNSTTGAGGMALSYLPTSQAAQVQRLDNDPLTGAMAGAMTGAAGEAASAAAKPLSAAARTFDKSAGENKTDRLFNARDVAAQKVAEAATLTNQELAARLKEYGKNATLMDVDPALAQAAGAIGTQSGRGQTFLRNVADKREVQSGKRVSDLIAQTIGPRGDGDALLSALDAEKKAAAGPFYAASLPTPVQDSDELQAIMRTPAFSSALSRANTLAGNEGRSLYSEKGAPDVGNMTLEDLHYIQRAMQDNIGDIKSGAGFKDNELSSSVAGVRQRLLAQMDAMSPDYQQARSIYSGSSRVRDAYDAGFGAFDNSTGANHLTNEMMERQLSGYDNQAERQAYLLGARQRMSNTFGAARNNRQRAYTLFGIGNDNPDFENIQKLSTLLSYVKPASNQEAALGAMQDDMRSRLGYTIASPEEEPITADSVHGPDNPLLNKDGELVSHDSDEGKQLISKRIADAEADRQEKAEEFAKQKAAALEFTGPDKARGKSLADALISGLKAERQFGETRDEVSGNSKTARRIEGKRLIASPEVEMPNNLPSGVARIAAALVNAAAGRTMQRRADAVNYEMARILAGSDTSLIPRSADGREPNPQPSELAPQSVPVSKIDPVTAALMRNPGIQRRKIQQDALTQALIGAAITQANIQGQR